MVGVAATYLLPMPIIYRNIRTRKCRASVQFPFLSSYSKIRIPDTSHCGIWYTTRAVISNPRRNSMRGFAIVIAMEVVVQE